MFANANPRISSDSGRSPRGAGNRILMISIRNCCWALYCWCILLKFGPGPDGTQKSVRIRGVPLLVRKQCHLCAHMNQRKFHFEYIQVKARDRSATLIFPYLLKPNDNSVVAARRYAESLITTVLLTLSSRAHVSQCPPCRDWHGSPVNYRRSDQIVVQHRREKW